ncbi:transcription factor grauzone-like [Bradysia coprophila]|uniref:transcription factor grauzone-like n=1 Tax=Bradysia coprophila TaxID=38358 RepID=UPI00187DD082|nr:transcription factor grauzone-like [Bradysia coprophila]
MKEIIAKSNCDSNNCILCMKATSSTTKIFGGRGQALKIAERLSQHFWFTFNDEVDESLVVCALCWEKIDQFHQFYESVREAHLHQIENPPMVEPKDKPKDDDSELLDWQWDNCDDTDNTVNSDEENPPKTSHQKIPRMNVNEGTTEPRNEKLEKPKTKPVTIDIERRVAEFFRMNCHLCDEPLSSLTKVSKHFRIKHNMERGYLICCCKKKAKVRKAVIEHVEWHMNPNLFRCDNDECSRTFNEKRALRKHMMEHQGRAEGPLDCSQCTKQFPNQDSLKRHVGRVHPQDNQKYTCDICKKDFKLKITLEAHMKYKHIGTSQQHICDICAKVLSTKQNLKEHANTHIDVPRLPCGICGALLKNAVCLAIHMKSHTDTKQTCDICLQVKANRTALMSHKRRVHGAAKHKCTLCDKSFTRPSAMREHIATHTGQDLYVCNYCPQTFKSDSNMYKHMKQVHAKQWTIDRKQR